MNRREFVAALAAGGAVVTNAKNGKLRIGCQTNAWKIDVPEFRNLLPVLEEIKKLGFEGFETGYRNVQGQFENVKEARELIRGTGLRFFGCHIFQFDYEPKTSIPAWELIERVAKGAQQLGAERLIVSGAPVGTDPERLRWKVGGLGRAGRLCRDLQMTRLLYHNHGPEFDNDAAELKALMRDTDPDIHCYRDTYKHFFANIHGNSHFHAAANPHTAFYIYSHIYVYADLHQDCIQYAYAHGHMRNGNTSGHCICEACGV